MVSASLERLLDDLNPAQRDAVVAGDGPLLVLAGAGSGKTRVIAHRIAWLLGVRGRRPRNLLAVTFTNKAAGEMARRVDALLPPAGLRAPLIATFHSACVRILRQHGSTSGCRRNFMIYDEDDRLALVKECMKGASWRERSFTPSAVAHRISSMKNHMMTVGDDALRARARAREAEVAAVYSRYEKRLRAAGAVDFDDLLLLAVRLLRGARPSVLDWYRGLWRHVLVDEYQDTNRAQYRIIRLLTSEHRNICVVGDPDQSDLQVGGARTSGTSSTSSSDFPGTQVVRLEQNYRSTKRILSLAAAVIAHNLQRKEKTLWTENAEGERARLYRAWDEHEEANCVAQTLLAAARRGRAVGQRRRGVLPHQRPVAGAGGRAPSRRASRTSSSAACGSTSARRSRTRWPTCGSSLNPADDVAFRRAIRCPRAGIGKTTLARLDEVAAREEPSAAGGRGRAAARRARQAAAARSRSSRR